MLLPTQPLLHKLWKLNLLTILTVSWSFCLWPILLVTVEIPTSLALLWLMTPNIISISYSFAPQSSRWTNLCPPFPCTDTGLWISIDQLIFCNTNIRVSSLLCRPEHRSLVGPLTQGHITVTKDPVLNRELSGSTSCTLNNEEIWLSAWTILSIFLQDVLIPPLSLSVAFYKYGRIIF